MTRPGAGGAPFGVWFSKGAVFLSLFFGIKAWPPARLSPRFKVYSEHG
jgi:hypothetical protein